MDWWALGVLMFEMMAGRSPFDIITDNPDMNTEDYLFQGAWAVRPAASTPCEISPFRGAGPQAGPRGCHRLGGATRPRPALREQSPGRGCGNGRGWGDTALSRPRERESVPI